MLLSAAAEKRSSSLGRSSSLAASCSGLELEGAKPHCLPSVPAGIHGLGSTCAGNLLRFGVSGAFWGGAGQTGLWLCGQQGSGRCNTDHTMAMHSGQASAPAQPCLYPSLAFIPALPLSHPAQPHPHVPQPWFPPQPHDASP